MRVKTTLPIKMKIASAFNTIATSITYKKSLKLRIILPLFLLLISVILLGTKRSLTFHYHRQSLPIKTQFHHNLNKYQYNNHSKLESHHIHMELNKTSSTLELYKIMSKQSNIYLHQDLSGSNYKKILYWTQYGFVSAFPEPFGLGVGRDVYKRAGCPVWQCETSQDRSNLSQYDAVLFHYLNFQGWDLPPIRFPNQLYVFFEYESPQFKTSHRGFFVPEMMNDFFNWTMSYRWDADVVHPYGWIEPNGSIPLHPNKEEYEKLISEPSEVNYAAGKTGMAAWMATKCKSPSGRGELVNKLIEHGIQVDVYGACGNMSCGISNYQFGTFKTDESDEPCRQLIGAKYKFYFALENALCRDYVTEKFYAMMRFPIILVVMDAHSNHARAAPPHSYINALDFPSISALADYLIKLDKNDKLYNEYFWWKKHFTVKNSLLSGIFYNNFCSLCAALHNPSHQNVIAKSYSDTIKWWVDDATCKTVNVNFGAINVG